AAIAFVLAFGVDLDAFFRQPIEQCIEVVHDVIHHERRLAGLEVFGIAWKNAPHRHLLAVGIVFLPPLQNGAMATIREPEMLSVPIPHLLLIRRFKEDPADSEDPALLAHACSFRSLIIMQAVWPFSSPPPTPEIRRDSPATPSSNRPSPPSRASSSPRI